jgi:subfamily B ATP-binding cassette protein HlyB/CyaB
MPPEKLLLNYPAPAMVIFNDLSYGILLDMNVQEGTVMILTPSEPHPRPVAFAELQAISSGEYIIFRHKPVSGQAIFGFRWFYEEIFHYKNVIVEVLTGSFIVQLFGLITPLFTQVILDKVIVHRTMTTLDVLAVAFIAVAIFEFLLNITRNYIFIHTASKIDAKLGAKLFRHLFALPFTYFGSRNVGNIVARVRELDHIREFITDRSVSVIIDIFFSFVFVIVMFMYSVKLTFVFIGFVVLVGILYLAVTPELRKRLENKFQMGAQANAYLVESVTGIQTVKALAIEGSMQRKWEESLARYVHSSFKLASMSNVGGAISSILQRFMTIVVLYLGVKLVMANQFTLGQLIAFQMFAGQFAGPFLRLVGFWNEFQQALLSVNRISDILNHPAEGGPGGEITLPSLVGSVRFDNVSFRYDHDLPYAIEQVNFLANPGISVGFVGRSGGGKSTITKLMENLYSPTGGTIYIDDIDIRHINPVWLRSNIGVVLQDDYLFSGTIKENISLPKPDASMDAIIAVAKTAGAHAFISNFPYGYETIVGERGSTLSGGQKQRIAIARALITNPKILIFDEATAALDYESEKIIQQNLSMITAGRTTFIVAHHLSAVRDCDIIIAMDDGKIIEMGTHDELIANKGYYHFLYTQQGEIRAERSHQC